jgi:hypothetical protein
VNKVVEIAMQTFTRLVDNRAGLRRKLDQATAIDMFQMLHGGGETYEPQEIITWLKTERGWEDDDAQAVGVIAKKVIDGKKQVCIRRIFGDVGLAHWRKQAAQL